MSNFNGIWVIFTTFSALRKSISTMVKTQTLEGTHSILHLLIIRTIIPTPKELSNCWVLPDVWNRKSTSVDHLYPKAQVETKDTFIKLG